MQKPVFKSLFISKNASELLTLHPFIDTHQIELTAHSFLNFTPVPFDLPERFDVVFFGSPRALMFFKSQYEIPSKAAIACVGSRTESLLQSMGYTIAFSGMNKGSISEVATEFATWLDTRTAFFPTSSRTLGTITDPIPPRQKIISTCYETTQIPKQLPSSEVCVFTSPSNVEAFLLENELNPNQTIIAWGKSSAAALHSHGVQVDHVLKSPDIACLLDVLERLD